MNQRDSQVAATLQSVIWMIDEIGKDKEVRMRLGIDKSDADRLKKWRDKAVDHRNKIVFNEKE